jgi:anti-anti-sigma regulatory factor
MKIRQSMWESWHIIGFEADVMIKYLHEVKAVFASLEALPQVSVALDFSDAHYIDSSSITQIILFQKALAKKSGVVVIFGGNETIAEAFTLVSLRDCLPIFQTRAQFEAHARNTSARPA